MITTNYSISIRVQQYHQGLLSMEEIKALIVDAASGGYDPYLPRDLIDIAKVLAKQGALKLPPPN